MLRMFRFQQECRYLLHGPLFWWAAAAAFLLAWAGRNFFWAGMLAVTAVSAGRSLGGSFQENLPGMLYTGSLGRKLAFCKLLSVLVVSAGSYAALSLAFSFGMGVFPFSGGFSPGIYWNGGGSGLWQSGDALFWMVPWGQGLLAVLTAGVLFSGCFLLLGNPFFGMAAVLIPGFFLFLRMMDLPLEYHGLLCWLAGSCVFLGQRFWRFFRMDL